MKYIVMLGDGMADVAVPELNMRTPLECAQKSAMDTLAREGMCGMARTVPQGFAPGSDTANLAVMGYDPAVYHRGRSPLEAVSMGIELSPCDVAMRCNLVTLSDEAELCDARMIDYCADEVSTQEARELIQYVAQHLAREGMELHAGISYRHCLVLRNALTGTDCTPPHDITGQGLRGYLPRGRYADMLVQMTQVSRGLLREHPVNIRRRERGLNPANACWFWGEGTAPALPGFAEKYGLRGGVVSAVDLVKGIGLCAGLEAPEIAGATANIHTDFSAKMRAALSGLLGGWDFVYIHIEAPDECGHRAEIGNKVRSIELIDREVLAPLLSGLARAKEPCCVLLLPDHPTPLHLRTHTSQPVPFALWSSEQSLLPHAAGFTERECAQTGVFVEQGFTLMDMLIHGKM